MAVNSSRSMNTDLQQGLLDGVHKFLTPDRGGEVERDAVIERAESLQAQYNMAEYEHPYGCCCTHCV